MVPRVWGSEQAVPPPDFAEAIAKQRPVVMPTSSPQIETQAFVYFNPDTPMEIEPVVLSGDEADLRNAIQALAPLLSDADRAKYRDIIDPKMPKTLRDRLKAWRQRNAS